MQLPTTLPTILVLAPALGALYAGALVVYRLFFHPLAKFPGPKLAAATGFYEAYYDVCVAPGGQFFQELKRLHKVYGPVVRINPHEIHVEDSAQADVIYVMAGKGVRDKYQRAASMLGTPGACFGTVDHHLHKRRRKALGGFFSKTTVASSIPSIQAKTARLLARIEDTIRTRGAAELRLLYMSLTTDTLLDHCFGTQYTMSWDLLNNESRAVDWGNTVKAVANLTPLAKLFTWLLPAALKLPPKLLRGWIPNLARLMTLHHEMRHQAALATQSYTPLEGSTSEEAGGGSKKTSAQQRRNIFHTILDDKELPASEKAVHRIAQEGFEMVVAGGETTSRVTTMATFHVLANRDAVLPRLREELLGVMPEPDSQPALRDLEALPWLTAVIKESLRISALITSRLPLASPKEAIVIGDWVIPPGTPVSMTLRDILLDPSVFEDASEFHPERWLTSNPDVERIGRSWLPFGKGSRMCPGQNLAMAQLYIVLAAVFRRWDNLELYDTTRERDAEVSRDCFIGESRPESKGVRVRFAELKA